MYKQCQSPKPKGGKCLAALYQCKDCKSVGCNGDPTCPNYNGSYQCKQCGSRDRKMLS